MILKKTHKDILKLCLILAAAFLSTFSSCTKDVSVSPPDAPPPNGYVYIDSYPQGFHIYLNGLPRRRVTPDSLTWLSTNTYSILLKKDLFRDTSFTVNIVEGVKKKIFIDFSQNPLMLGSISLTSNPTNASVFINDSNTNKKTPVTFTGLLPGFYTIKLHADNHRDDTLQVTVSSSNVTLAEKTLVDTTLWNNYDTGNSQIATNQLTCLAVDKDNIIWLGDPGNGLLKFDGRTWENFGDKIPSGPAQDTINCIYVDNNNHKWVGTEFGGVVEIYNNNVSVYGYRSSGLPDFRVMSVTGDDNGNIYIGTQDGLTRTWISNGYRNWYTYTLEELPFPQEVSWFTALAIDANHNLWIGTQSSGIGVLPAGLYTTSNSSIISDEITALVVSGTKVWAGHPAGQVFGTGISYYNGSSWQATYPLPTGSFAQCIFVDHLGNQWFGTNNELVKQTVSGGTTVFNSQSTGLNLVDIRGIGEDQSGNIWIATYGSGLIEYKGNH